jgi:hypothetical protein
MAVERAESSRDGRVEGPLPRERPTVGGFLRTVVEAPPLAAAFGAAFLIICWDPCLRGCMYQIYGYIHWGGIKI